jgi:hypothetical protein
MANAILYSSLIDKAIDLPMDASAYEAMLNKLIAESKFQKTTKVVANEDFTKSFTK